MSKNKLWIKKAKTMLSNINANTGLQSCFIALVFLSTYHFLQPKPLTLGMINLHDINQSFIYFLAQQDLTDAQKSVWLERFSNALNEEVEQISKNTVLFSAQQVVTPLPDYTSHIKVGISEKMKVKNDPNKPVD